jgi:hypothetical protein
MLLLIVREFIHALSSQCLCDRLLEQWHQLGRSGLGTSLDTATGGDGQLEHENDVALAERGIEVEEIL